MLRFSLAQILAATGALSAGLALVRLSDDWTDLPLVVLGLYFIAGLSRQAAATWRQLAEPEHSPAERFGGRLLFGPLLLTTLVLAATLVARVPEAAGFTWTWTDEKPLTALFFWTYSSDVAVLAMIAALWLGAREPAQASAAESNRHRAYAAIAYTGGIIAALVQWAINMSIWLFVMIAIWSLEASQRPIGAPDATLPLRIDRFTIGSFAGLCLVIVNLLLIGAVIEGWRRLRRFSILLLVLGLTAECAAAAWIAGPGLRQLSQPIHEATMWPWPEDIATAGTMLVLTIGALSLRLLADRTSTGESPPTLRPRTFFHERWPAGLLLGLFALIRVLPIGVFMYVYQYPGGSTDVLWLAAAIAGFSLAWRGFRGRTQLVDGSLPRVDREQWAVFIASAFTWFILSAPILLAASLSYWFVQFEMGPR